MTANEIFLHSAEEGTTALAIVTRIKFIGRGEDAKCIGGSLEFLYPWELSKWDIVPTAFTVKRP